MPQPGGHVSTGGLSIEHEEELLASWAETRVDGPCQGTAGSFWISRGTVVHRCSRFDRAGFAPLAIIPY